MPKLVRRLSPCSIMMAVSRAVTLVTALLLVSLASFVQASDQSANGLAVIPQVSGAITMPVTKPKDLAQGAPLYVSLWVRHWCSTRRRVQPTVHAALAASCHLDVGHENSDSPHLLCSVYSFPH